MERVLFSDVGGILLECKANRITLWHEEAGEVGDGVHLVGKSLSKDVLNHAIEPILVPPVAI